MIDNPYWDAVKDFVIDDPYRRTDGPRTQVISDLAMEHSKWSEVGVAPPSTPAEQRRYDAIRAQDWHFFPRREELFSRYQFSIPDPGTIEFLLRHVGRRALDPIAGSGYLAWLLNQSGVDTLAFDQHPWRWTYGTINRGWAPYTVARYGHDRTLILSWPDDGDRTIEQVLAAYRGDRVITIANRDFCGTKDLWSTLDEDWHRVGFHIPVSWTTGRDFVVVYHRVHRSRGWYLFPDSMLTRNPRHASAIIRAAFEAHTFPCQWAAVALLDVEINETRVHPFGTEPEEAGLWIATQLLARPELCTCGGMS